MGTGKQYDEKSLKAKDVKLARRLAPKGSSR